MSAHIFGIVALVLAIFFTLFMGSVARNIMTDRSIARTVAVVGGLAVLISGLAFVGALVFVVALAYPTVSERVALTLMTLATFYAVLRHFRAFPKAIR